MSLITQCPACQTLFKVVADQLQVSQGWVRCGQCQNVFDANVHLYTQALVEAEPASDQALADDAMSPLHGVSVEQHFSAHGPVDVDLSTQIPSTEHHAYSEPKEPYVPIEQIKPFDVAPSPPGTSDALNLQIKDKPLSFLRKPPKRLKYVSPWERAGLALVVLLLSAGFLVQIAAHERDLIAAHEPRLKPWLEDFCDAMKCRVRALRQIEAVVIESSSFTKIRPDLYTLNFSLKNTSDVALAVPAIEISLTDAHDQALVRKVLREKDLNFHTNTLAPGVQSTGSAMVNLTNADVSQRIAGYRILAFYP